MKTPKPNPAPAPIKAATGEARLEPGLGAGDGTAMQVGESAHSVARHRIKVDGKVVNAFYASEDTALKRVDLARKAGHQAEYAGIVAVDPFEHCGMTAPIPRSAQPLDATGTSMRVGGPVANTVGDDCQGLDLGRRILGVIECDHLQVSLFLEREPGYDKTEFVRAYVGGEPVGELALDRPCDHGDSDCYLDPESSEIGISNIEVREDLHRKGIARGLVRAAEAYLGRPLAPNTPLTRDGSALFRGI